MKILYYENYGIMKIMYYENYGIMNVDIAELNLVDIPSIKSDVKVNNFWQNEEYRCVKNLIIHNKYLQIFEDKCMCGQSSSSVVLLLESIAFIVKRRDLNMPLKHVNTHRFVGRKCGPQS